MTGWYPDPGGQPDRYRYWDGRSWSAETTTDPADPPPGSGTRHRPASTEDHRRYSGAAFGIAALALVVVVVSTVMIIRRTADPEPLGAPDGGPAHSASSWDDSSPVPRAGTPGTDGGTATPGEQLTCPIADPAELAPHPADDRVHGGRLSMVRVAGYSAPEPEYMLSWMSDTQGVSQTTEPGWQSIFAVGELQRATDFGDVREATHSSMSCAMHTSWYLHLAGHKTVRDEAITVDGHQGWILTWNVYDDSPDITVPGDQLTFVAVDDGRTDAYSMWCGMVPIGDGQRIGLDAQVLAGLKVTG